MTEKIPRLVTQRLNDFVLLQEIINKYPFILDQLKERNLRAYNIIVLRYGLNDGLIRSALEIKGTLELDISHKRIYQIIDSKWHFLREMLRREKDKEKDEKIRKDIQKNYSSTPIYEIFRESQKYIAVRLMRLGIATYSDLSKLSKMDLYSLVRECKTQLDYSDYDKIIRRLNSLGVSLKGEGKIFLEDAGFSTRVYLILRREGFCFLEEVAKYNESDLLKIRGFGGKGIEEVKDVLSKYNLSLGSAVGFIIKPDSGQDIFLDQLFDSGQLSVRSYNIFKKEGLHTLREVTEYGRLRLMNIRNFGPLSLKEIETLLREYNIPFKD